MLFPPLLDWVVTAFPLPNRFIFMVVKPGVGVELLLHLTVPTLELESLNSEIAVDQHVLPVLPSYVDLMLFGNVAVFLILNFGATSIKPYL